MASIKDIRNKITSIQNIQKVTKAMEMVAVSKMHKSRNRMIASRPYTETIRKVISYLTTGNLEYKSPYLKERYDIKRIGYLVISTNRGLCGSLNINLFKVLLADIKSLHDKGIKSELLVIGSKGVSFFDSIGVKIIKQIVSIENESILSELMSLIKLMLYVYDKCHLDKIYLASNRFINTLSQIPIINQILPIKIDKVKLKSKIWDYLYESDPKILLDALVYRYIESQVYQSVVENLFSEQSARMVAMKTATDNGYRLQEELKLVYNKTRQANITQELTEIISGANAI